MIGKTAYRFIRGWQTYAIGDVIYPTGMHREWLEQSGIIERVEEPELETATVDQEMEHAALRVDRPAPRRRGRPKGSKNIPKIGA